MRFLWICPELNSLIPKVDMGAEYIVMAIAGVGYVFMRAWIVDVRLPLCRPFLSVLWNKI